MSLGSKKHITKIREEREIILKAVDSFRHRHDKPKSYPLSNSVKSLERSWVDTWNSSRYAGDIRMCHLKANDRIKVSLLTGNSRVRGKWIGSVEDLHALVRWSVGNWNKIVCRMSWATKMPQTPNVGWFVSQLDEIHSIWMDSKTDLHPGAEKTLNQV